MDRKKQIMLFVLIFGIIVFVSAMNFPAFSSGKQGKQSWDNLTISMRGNIIKIFDAKTGMFYTYDDNKGKVTKMWQLEQLGKDLKRVRSVN